MEATVERATRDLTDLRPAAILYCCTNATSRASGGQDENAADKILKGSGVRGITTSSAVISVLRALNLKRVFMVSPTMDDIVAGTISFLRYHDVAVLNNFSIKHRDRGGDPSQASPDRCRWRFSGMHEFMLDGGNFGYGESRWKTRRFIQCSFSLARSSCCRSRDPEDRFG